MLGDGVGGMENGSGGGEASSLFAMHPVYFITV